MSIINAGLDMSNPTGLGDGPSKEMDYGETFEIHITGDDKIHEAAGEWGLKTIQVELFRPDGTSLRIEHMTSIVKKFDFYEAALRWTINAVGRLKENCEITRVKIESPPYPHYLFLAKYAEVHFKDNSFKYPTSKQPSKNYYLATERVNMKFYDWLRSKWPNEQLEICLFDDNMAEDMDWLELWQ